MAKVQFGNGIVGIQGKVGGLVFQRSVGGPIVRIATAPVQVQPHSLQVSKGKFASIANAWTAALTQQQRLAWEAYAKNNGTTISSSKQPLTLGRMLFTRLNRAIIDAEGLPILDPPLYEPPFVINNPNIYADSTDNVIALIFDGDPILPPYVLSIRMTQPYLAANVYKSNSCTFIQNESPAVSPIDCSDAWRKVHGAWNLIPGCVIYGEPYIVNKGTGQISPPIKIKGIVL